METPKKIHDIEQSLAGMRTVAAHAAHAYKALRTEGVPARYAVELTKTIITAAFDQNRENGS